MKATTVVMVEWLSAAGPLRGVGFDAGCAMPVRPISQAEDNGTVAWRGASLVVSEHRCFVPSRSGAQTNSGMRDGPDEQPSDHTRRFARRPQTPNDHAAGRSNRPEAKPERRSSGTAWPKAS